MSRRNSTPPPVPPRRADDPYVIARSHIVRSLLLDIAITLLVLGALVGFGMVAATLSGAR